MPSPESFDLDLYFARVDYSGPHAPTLDVLSNLQQLHTRAIPFENLDPLIGRQVSLRQKDLVAKLIESHRGGYCFEQNTLFANVLLRLGFNVTPLIARVLWGQEPGAMTPPTHMLLRVDIDATAWLVDVGFGGVTAVAPLRLVKGEEQKTPFEAFRIADASNGLLDLEVNSGGVWIKVYRFDLRPVEWVDYELSNWYTSTYPESLFRKNLIAARVVGEGRVALLDNRITERAKDGYLTAERTLRNATELAGCLRAVFGIDIGNIDVADLFTRFQHRSQQSNGDQAG